MTNSSEARKTLALVDAVARERTRRGRSSSAKRRPYQRPPEVEDEPQVVDGQSASMLALAFTPWNFYVRSGYEIEIVYLSKMDDHRDPGPFDEQKLANTSIISLEVRQN